MPSKKKISRFTTAIIIMTVLYGSAVVSQEIPEMVTDRPDQSESSNIVQPGFVQIESGLLLTHTGDNDVTEIPGTLARIGLLEKLELRIGIDGWIMDDAEDNSEFGDSEISVKYFLCEESGWIPESAILAGIGIPTAKGSDKAGYTLRYAGGYTLSEKFSTGFNVASAWEEGDDNLDMSMMYSAVLGYGINERTGCFIEFFGESPVEAGGKPSNLIDGGFTYLINPQFQLDAYGGAGMTDAAEDWFLGAGISWLIGY
ncbi:transporter [Candidatus Latescibacterota bacterium]